MSVVIEHGILQVGKFLFARQALQEGVEVVRERRARISRLLGHGDGYGMRAVQLGKDERGSVDDGDVGDVVEREGDGQFFKLIGKSAQTLFVDDVRAALVSRQPARVVEQLDEAAVLVDIGVCRPLFKQRRVYSQRLLQFVPLVEIYGRAVQERAQKFLHDRLFERASVLAARQQRGDEGENAVRFAPRRGEQREQVYARRGHKDQIFQRIYAAVDVDDIGYAVFRIAARGQRDVLRLQERADEVGVYHGRERLRELFIDLRRLFFFL